MTMMMLLSAVTVAACVAPIAWFEVAYLLFGATGADPGGAVDLAVAFATFVGSVGWSLHGARRPAQVVRNGCRAGIALSIALPVVTIAVLLLWLSADDRPDLGMGGLMLYSMPVVAVIAAIVLVVLFTIVRDLASRRLAHD